MADLYGVDVTIHQSYAGSPLATGVSFISDAVASLTISNLLSLGGVLEAALVPLLNDLQVEGVNNVSMHLQARGGLTPSVDFPLEGGGSFVADPDTYMPPEFAYWVRWYVNETFNSLGGAANTANPVRRGGLFISGASDEALDNGVFSPSLPLLAARSALSNYLQSAITLGAITYTGAVIGEEIVSGTGWRVAEIAGSIMPRITRLRSRKAAGG